MKKHLKYLLDRYKDLRDRRTMLMDLYNNFNEVNIDTKSIDEETESVIKQIKNLKFQIWLEKQIQDE